MSKGYGRRFTLRTQLLLWPLLAVIAPLLARAADSSERSAVAFAPTRAVLVLIAAADATRALGEHKLANTDVSGAQEQDLQRECANGETQHAQATRSFFLAVATNAWQVLLHPLAVSVHDELLKYASVSDATASGDYYHGAESGGRNAPLSSRITCLRFTRFAGTDGEDVALDFVAGVLLDGPHDAIRLRPLRLFISQAAAKSATGRYSVAVGVRANAVWREEFAGHEAVIFDKVVATENVDLKSGSYLKYYPLDATSGTRVPIVPISFGADRGQDFGRAEFGVRVAELGAAPTTLKLLSEMLPDPDQKLSGMVIAAAIAGVGH
jgi:hypothetical protein